MAPNDNETTREERRAERKEERADARPDLQARLEKARAARELARQKREKLETQDELQRKVEAEELAATDEEALFNAEAEHGRKRVATIETEMGTIIVKRPNPLHFKRFQDKESVKTKDLEQLVRPCLVHPSANRFDAILEEYPATLTRCADRVATLAGVRARELSGK